MRNNYTKALYVVRMCWLYFDSFIAFEFSICGQKNKIKNSCLSLSCLNSTLSCANLSTMQKGLERTVGSMWDYLWVPIDVVAHQSEPSKPFIGWPCRKHENVTQIGRVPNIWIWEWMGWRFQEAFPLLVFSSMFGPWLDVLLFLFPPPQSLRGKVG